MLQGAVCGDKGGGQDKRAGTGAQVWGSTGQGVSLF